MTKYTPEIIKAAAKQAGRWKKIYNATCRICKPKMFNAVKNIKTKGAEDSFDNMGKVLNEDLCPICKKRTENLLK